MSENVKRIEKNAINIDVYEATISTCYLSAIINGDETGIDDDKEAMQLMAWELGMYEKAKADGAKNWHWSYDECYNYAKCDITGLFGRVADVRLIAYFTKGA